MTRIALILHGGGALGSYTAGACTEILLALDRNRSAAEFSVDVITASSSGGLTAALAARALVVNRYTVPWIERTWIDALGPHTLLNADRPDRAGLLDGRALSELGKALIAAEPASDDAPLDAFRGSLHLGLCVATIAGATKPLCFAAPGDASATASVATVGTTAEFELTEACRAGHPVWEMVHRAAVAATSFPIAFPPTATAGPAVDSGVFHSGALTLARRLAAAEGASQEERLFMVIDPFARRGNPAAAQPRATAGTVGVAAAWLGEAALREAAATDLLVAGGSGSILDELITRLPELIERLDDPEAIALGRHVGDLAERAAELSSAYDGGEADDRVMQVIDANIRRIEADPRVADVLQRARSRSGRTRLAKLIYVLEAAAGVGRNREGRTCLVAPTDPEALACRALGSLGGFLNREWRAADFRAGRRDARDAIGRALRGLIEYEPDPADSYRTSELGHVAPLSTQEQQALRAFIEDEVERMLRGARPGPVAAMFGAWRGAVKRHIADRVLAALGGST